MIHIKKILSLLLVTVLIMTSFVSFAEDEEEYTDPEIWGDLSQDTAVDETEETQDEQIEGTVLEEKSIKESFSPVYSGIDRVNIHNPDDTQMLFKALKAFGIMDSYENPDEIVTRGEFSGFIARIMQGGKSQKNSSYRYEFKDVDETVANQSDIIYLANNGIVQGDGQGCFYPDNNIKSTEALVMLLNAMGYYEIAGMYGEGLTGYMMVASKLKLSNEVKIGANTELTRESAVKLIYYALHERVADFDLVKDASLTFQTTDETLMYRYMNIMTIEGIVTSNEYTSLNSANGAVPTNCLKIGDTILNFSQSSIVPADYLGLYTRVYYRENSGNCQAMFADCMENGQKILKINAEDIIDYNKQTKTLRYEKNDKVKTELIPINASIIFNKVAVSGSIDAHAFTPDAGQLVFIDNGGDRNYDCIMIDSYTTYVVKNSLSDDMDILYDKLSLQPMIPLDSKKVRVIKNNSEAKANDVLSGNVAMVASNKVSYETIDGITYSEVDPSSAIYTVLVSDYQVKGNLQAITGDSKVVIDDIEYKYSCGFIVSAKKGASNMTVESMLTNVSVTAGLDPDGNIAWLDRESDTGIKYGYLVSMSPAKTFQNDLLKVYSQDNEMLDLSFADSVKVFAQWKDGSISNSTYYSKKINGTDVTDINLLYSGNACKQQLVQYKLDSDGKVSEIYLPANDSRSYTQDVPSLYDNILYKSCTLTDTYFFKYNSGGVISPLFEYNRVSTIGFAVPDNPDITDEKYFTAHRNEITLFNNGGKIGKIDLYNVDNGRIGAFVYKQSVNITEGDISVMFDSGGSYLNVIVEDVRQALDSEGEVITKLTAYYQNKLTKFECPSVSLISHPNANDPDLDEVKITELKRGDIILIHRNSLKQIDGFKVVHRVHKAIADAGDASIPAYEQQWDGKAYNLLQPAYPKLFVRGEVVKTIDDKPYVYTGRSDGLLRRILLYGTVNQLVIYDVEDNNMILTQNKNKISDFSQLQEGDYIFWYQTDRAIVSAVAIRNYK